MQDTEALIDHISLVLCAGRMNAHTRSSLLELLDVPYFENGQNPVEKICLALYGAVIAPEAAIVK